jgi:hypothetical protein
VTRDVLVWFENEREEIMSEEKVGGFSFSMALEVKK